MSNLTEAEWDEMIANAKMAHSNAIHEMREFEMEIVEPTPITIKPCPSCNGFGIKYIFFTCNACGGSGTKHVPDFEAVHQRQMERAAKYSRLTKAIIATSVNIRRLKTKKFLALHPDHIVTKAYYDGVLLQSPCDEHFHLMDGRCFDLDGNETKAVDRE